LNTAAWGLT